MYGVASKSVTEISIDGQYPNSVMSMPTRAASNYLRYVKSANTTPELVVRKALWSNGFRYRIHHPGLPGKPDIVFMRQKIAIFVHGCFWHRHACARAFNPKTNSEFWQQKFQRNRKRDEEVDFLLTEAGWSVIILWECEIKNDLSSCIEKITRLPALAKDTHRC